MRIVHYRRGRQAVGQSVGKRFLTIPEAARELGITPTAFWKRLYRGLIPYKRLGGRVIIDLYELQSFMEGLPGRTAAEALKTVRQRMR